MQYIKKFNNNVALAKDQANKEWILIGKGVGFGKKMDDKIEENEIERRFLAEPSKDFSYIVQTIFSIDPIIIEAVNEMVTTAENMLKIKFNDNNYLTLIDHISFALERAKSGIEYSEPVIWETKRLYPKEYTVAAYTIQVLNHQLKITLPKSEETFIALHFVNAQNNPEKMAQADFIKIIIQNILNFITEEYQITLDKDSITYIRFITHLRYFIIRQINQEPLKTSKLDDDLLNHVKTKYHDAYLTAEGIGERLRRKTNWQISENEILFLTIHIERLTNNI